MNFADVIIIMLCATGLARGSTAGFIRQACSTIGTASGVAIGILVQLQVVKHAGTTTSKSLLGLLVLVACASIGMWIGEICGLLLRLKLQERHVERLEKLDRVSGSVVGGVTVLLAVWLAVNLFSRVPGTTLQQQLNGSFIVARLNTALPKAPPIIASISHLIAPNGFPDVFTGTQEPRIDTSTPLPSIGSLDAAVQQDRVSVVKVMGQGCGGISEGSGFVVDTNLVVTNAHVIAGVAQPEVIDGMGQHKTTVVAFDPDLDVAVLRTSNLTDKPLTLGSVASVGAATAALGYPGGGDFSAQPATVLRTFVATGRNIYDRGEIDRTVYALKVDVEPGNSGGPLVNTRGDVVGLIFARSTVYPEVGYGLTLQQLLPTIQHAQQATTAVATQTCAQ